MKNINDLIGKKVYFIGIGGISMSGLAKILYSNGANVTGSDIGNNPEIDILRKLGITINNSHIATNITKDIDLVIFSGAIKEDNDELLEAKRLGVLIMERSEFLGVLASGYENVIVISGTHGKTTTTSMLGYIFYRAGLNPTVHIGGESNNFQSNIVIGGKKYLIIEGCEYRESFRYLKPTTLVITNIEKEHLDYFVTFDNMLNAFEKLAKNSNKVFTGANLKCGNIININDVCSICNVKINGKYTTFDVYYKNQYLDNFELGVIGRFNINNAIFAICVAIEYGININIIKDALKDFTGVKRRYECIGKIATADIIIDYAHHPTEILNSINGIKEHYNNILCVFQPHTYTRTITLWQEFFNVLSGVDNIILYPTYPAREKEIVGGRAIDLYNALPSKNKIYVSNSEDLMTLLNNNCKKYEFDCVLILGAGDLADILKGFLNS